MEELDSVYTNPTKFYSPPPPGSMIDNQSRDESFRELLLPLKKAVSCCRGRERGIFFSSVTIGKESMIPTQPSTLIPASNPKKTHCATRINIYMGLGGGRQFKAEEELHGKRKRELWESEETGRRIGVRYDLNITCMKTA